MKDDTILYIGGALGIGYLLYKLGKPVQDTGEGVATAVGGLGSGISEIGTSTGGAVSDILSLTKPLKAISDWAVSDIEDAQNSSFNFSDVITPIPNAIKSLFKSTPTPQGISTKFTPMTPIYGVNYNPFINPTSQSFYTDDMAKSGYTEAPLSIQNTVALSKTDSTIKNAISNKIATPTGKIVTTSSTARYTGGIGKSSVTQKKK